MKRIFMLLACSVLLLSATAFAGETGSGVPVIIDVRTEAEWQTGHLEGAQLIPHEQIGDKISAVTGDKKSKIYLYCRTGRRSGLAYDTLQKLGYGNMENAGTMESAAAALGKRIVK